MTRVLGLDVGDQRIGVAISDELRITTRGLLTIKRTNTKEDIRKIADLASENNCSGIIVGLPLNLSGDDSKQTEKVRLFAKKLENKVGNTSKDSKIGVFLWDERYSTKTADEIMDEVGLSKAKRKEIIDQQAACIILEDWIDSNPEVGH